jgi:hypothetical protein
MLLVSIRFYTDTIASEVSAYSAKTLHAASLSSWRENAMLSLQAEVSDNLTHYRPEEGLYDDDRGESYHG